MSKENRRRQAKNEIEAKISFKKGVRMSNFRAPKLLKKTLRGIAKTTKIAKNH
jgi:hypothetical protein